MVMRQQRRSGVEYHRRINVGLWHDSRFCSLSQSIANSRYLYLFLRVGPYSGVIPGLFLAHDLELADHLGWPLEAFHEAFAEIVAAKLVIVDWTAGVIWIPDALFDQPPQSLAVVRSWRKAWNEIPECAVKVEAYQYFLVHMSDLSQLFVKAFVETCVKPSVRRSGGCFDISTKAFVEACVKPAVEASVKAREQDIALAKSRNKSSSRNHSENPSSVLKKEIKHKALSLEENLTSLATGIHRQDNLVILSRGITIDAGQPSVVRPTAVRLPAARPSAESVCAHLESKQSPASNGSGLVAEQVTQRRQQAKRKRKGERSGVSPTPSDAPSSPALFGLPEVERDQLVRLFSSESKKKAGALKKRRELGDRIAEEVLRVYKFRRKEATGQEYHVKDRGKLRDSAREGGLACIRLGVTPEQVIDFWIENDFTEQRFPALSFVCGERNVDRAAASIVPTKGGTGAQSKGPTRAIANEDWQPDGPDDNEELLARDAERRERRGV